MQKNTQTFFCIFGILESTYNIQKDRIRLLLDWKNRKSLLINDNEKSLKILLKECLKWRVSCPGNS